MAAKTSWLSVTDGFSALVKGCFDKKSQDVKIAPMSSLYERLEACDPGRRLLQRIDHSYYKGLLFGDPNTIGYEDINRNVMLSQIVLLEDSAWVLYSKGEGEDLEAVHVTANKKILEENGYDWGSASKMIVKKNREGFVKAFRIDVEFGPNGTIKSRKIVNPRQFDIDDIKGRETTRNFIIIPDCVYREFFRSIKDRMDSGKIFKLGIVTTDNAVYRFTTSDPETLASMCDCPAIARQMKPRYLFETGSIYVPELGSPSISSMFTRIDPFNLWKISETTLSAAKREGVHKPVNILRNALAEEILKGSMMQKKYHDNDAYSAFMYNLNPGAKLLDREDATPVSLSKFLHTLTEKGKETVFGRAGILPQVQRIMRFFDSEEFVDVLTYLRSKKVPLTDADVELYNSDYIAFLKKFKSHWYRAPLLKVQYWAKSGSISSMMVSNDTDVLMEAYGQDYAKAFESFNSKFKNIESDFMPFLTGNFEKAKARLSYLMGIEGLAYNDRMFTEIKRYVESCKPTGDVGLFMRSVKREVAEANNVTLEASEAASKNVKESAEKRDTYLFRTLCGYIGEKDKPEEFFKFVDLNKIRAIYVIA